MNENQKKLTLVTLVLFIFSIAYLPKEFYFYDDGDGGPIKNFMGYRWIFQTRGDIAIKYLLVEWFRLLVLFIGLFFYFKSNKDTK